MKQHYRTSARRTMPLWLALTLVALLAGQLRAETVRLPMTVDLPLLRMLIVERAYQHERERASVYYGGGGCNQIWLANPQLSEERGLLRFATEVSIDWGTPFGETCLAPLSWRGSVVFWQQPLLDQNWQLRLLTRDSRLLDAQGNQAPLAGLLWDLVKTNVHAYISSIVINLAPPVDNLKWFIMPAEEAEMNTAASRFLASMRPDTPVIIDNSVRFNVLADADVAVAPEAQQRAPAVPDERVEERLMALWHTWDSLLIHLIGQLSGKELSEEDRQLLFDTLLSVRYEFNEVIGTPQLTTPFIREQFQATWSALRPLFYRHLVPKSGGESILGYLSFFTAADALVTLDTVGPLLGIEISREGFYRLAHLLGGGTMAEGLEIDTRLREVLGLERPNGSGGKVQVPPANGEPDAPAWPEVPEQQEGIPMEEEGLAPPSGRLPTMLFRNVAQLLGPSPAAASSTPKAQAIREWTAGITPAGKLLPKVKTILDRSAAEKKAELDDAVGSKGWGKRMVSAAAWQESCFRQFVVKNKKITYLLSYNQTSVGIMQVNEKVWRGLYDVQELRWNPEYNVTVGVEILALYLNRYLLRGKAARSLSGDKGRRQLAIWLYSLYNGGPSQLKKFPERYKTGKLYKSEQLFQAKYDQVVGRNWPAKVTCLPAS